MSSGIVICMNKTSAQIGQPEPSVLMYLRTGRDRTRASLFVTGGLPGGRRRPLDREGRTRRRRTKNSGARRDDAREARDVGFFQFPVVQHLVHQVERDESDS